MQKQLEEIDSRGHIKKQNTSEVKTVNVPIMYLILIVTQAPLSPTSI